MRISTAAIAVAAPPPLQLAPEEEGALATYLAAHSSYDLHGAVGLMHALASSPAPIPFTKWRSLVHRDEGALSARDLIVFDHLLCVASTIVRVELGQRRPFAPPSADAAACASFARGYLVGLELWPSSVPRVDRLRCAAWACALGERLDLLPASDRARFRLTEEGRAALRREIGRFIQLTHDIYALA